MDTAYEMFGLLLKAERPLLLPGESTLSFAVDWQAPLPLKNKQKKKKKKRPRRNRPVKLADVTDDLPGASMDVDDETAPPEFHSVRTYDMLDFIVAPMGVTAHSFPTTQDIVPRTDFDRANVEADQRPYPSYQSKHVALVDKEDYDEVFAVWDQGLEDALPYVKMFDDPEAMTKNSCIPWKISFVSSIHPLNMLRSRT
ncbi:hypothetical protein BC832DRAFT_589108 [Gaertneriomyces semiglobifer]|nr:hypothetical protein BC832DRAFT_589108 [Gaertneriomyces semiglobifer]